MLKEIITETVQGYRYKWKYHQDFTDNISFAFNDGQCLFTYFYAADKMDLDFVKPLLMEVKTITLSKEFEDPDKISLQIEKEILYVKGKNETYFDSVVSNQQEKNYTLETLTLKEYGFFKTIIFKRYDESKSKFKKMLEDHLKFAFLYYSPQLIDPSLYLIDRVAIEHLLKPLDGRLYHNGFYVAKCDNLMKTELQRLKNMFTPSNGFKMVKYLEYFRFETHYKFYNNTELFNFVKHNFQRLKKFVHYDPIEFKDYNEIELSSIKDDYDAIDLCVYTLYLADKINISLNFIEFKDGFDFKTCINVKNQFSRLLDDEIFFHQATLRYSDNYVSYFKNLF